MQVLVLEEKHSNSVYRIENREECARVALHILRQRSEEGYYYPTSASLREEMENQLRKADDSEYTSLTEDEVDSLPPSLKEKAIKKREKIAKQRNSITSYYQQDIRWAELLEKLLAAPKEEAVKMTVGYNGRKLNLAWWLFDARSDYEYEGFVIEDVIVVE